MIEELVYYLGAKTQSPAARRLGYVYETAALQAKHRRYRTAWRPHLHATRQALLAAANIDTRGTALILGGGIVQDLPVSELLERFECIILLDIVFTYQARRLAQRWPDRILCCYYDVTGVIDSLAKYRCLPPIERLSAFQQPNAKMPPVCWVASVNCLTQLPILPVRWLQHCGIEDRSLDEFYRALIQDHLNWLMGWQVRTCLITEVEEQHFDRNGSLIGSVDHRPLLQDFQQKADCLSRWTWHLHPRGALSSRHSETRTVEALSYPDSRNSH